MFIIIKLQDKLNMQTNSKNYNQSIFTQAIHLHQQERVQEHLHRSQQQALLSSFLDVSTPFHGLIISVDLYKYIINIFFVLSRS